MMKNFIFKFRFVLEDSQREKIVVFLFWVLALTVFLPFTLTFILRVFARELIQENCRDVLRDWKVDQLLCFAMLDLLLCLVLGVFFVWEVCTYISWKRTIVWCYEGWIFSDITFPLWVFVLTLGFYVLLSYAEYKSTVTRKFKTLRGHPLSREELKEEERNAAYWGYASARDREYLRWKKILWWIFWALSPFFTVFLGVSMYFLGWVLHGQIPGLFLDTPTIVEDLVGDIRNVIYISAQLRPYDYDWYLQEWLHANRWDWFAPSPGEEERRVRNMDFAVYLHYDPDYFVSPAYLAEAARIRRGGATIPFTFSEFKKHELWINQLLWGKYYPAADWELKNRITFFGARLSEREFDHAFAVESRMLKRAQTAECKKNCTETLNILLKYLRRER